MDQVAIFLGILIPLILATGAYVVRRSVWETKMELWVRAIFRRLDLIEKHLGITVGGEIIDEYPDSGRDHRDDYGNHRESDHSSSNDNSRTTEQERE